MEVHTRRIWATIMTLGILLLLGAWLFKKPPINLHKGLAWFEESNDNATFSDILLFPNATARVSLTLKQPISATLLIEGTGSDLILGMNGKQVRSTIGTLNSNVYHVTTTAITTLSLDNDFDEDRNNNGISDHYEQRHLLNLNKIDPDRDNLTTNQEFNYFIATGREINPSVSDTDGDGSPDGTEVNIGTNPTDPSDVPIHGFSNEPWFFTINALFSQEDLEALWSFDNRHMDALGRHPLSLLENTTITPGLFGMGLQVSLHSKGARGQPSLVFQRLKTFTLSAWIRTLDNRSRYIVSIPTNQGLPGIALDFGSSKPSCTITVNNRTISSKTKHWRILSDNIPHHIACIKNQTSLNLYIDGNLEESIGAEPVAPDAEGYLLIGNHNSQDRFNGIIDTILLYREAISSDAVATQFLAFNEVIDQDQDGMSDAWEARHRLSSQVQSDSRRDDDFDGLINLQEYHYFLLTERELDPKKSDTDLDGYSDLFEIRKGSNPLDATQQPVYHQSIYTDFNYDNIPDYFELAFGLSINQPIADQDPDKDGLTNQEEYNYFANTGRLIHPLLSDSDKDGSPDKDEIDKEEDPSGKQESLITIPLPGRFHIDLPNQAIIERAAVRFSQPVNLTMTGTMQWNAQGLVDISSLLNTTCPHSLCRQEIKVLGPKQVTVSDIDIRYTTSSLDVEGAKLCATYPCTILLSIKSKTPGKVRVTIAEATPCKHDCDGLLQPRKNSLATGALITALLPNQSNPYPFGLFLILISSSAAIGILIGYKLST